MGILLFRHGEAVKAHGSDEARYLTMSGRSETLAVARALHARSMRPAQIVASPLVRAVQTAEIIAHALGYEGLVTIEPSLVPDGDPRAAVRNVPMGAALVICVCHEPIIRGIAAALTQQPSFHHFKTSGCALIEGARVVLELDPDRV